MRKEDISEGMYVRIISTGQVGIVEYIEEYDEEVSVILLKYGDDDIGYYGYDEIEQAEPVELTAEEVRRLVRCEYPMEKLTPSCWLYENCTFAGNYQLSLEDLKAGIEKWAAVEADSEAFCSWKRFLGNVGSAIGLRHWYSYKSYMAYDTNMVQAYVFAQIGWLYDDYYGKEPSVIKKEDLEDILEIITEYQEDMDKPLAQKRIPVGIMWAVVDQLTPDDLDEASEEEQVLFVECLERLCAAEEPKALQKKGYCLYNGTKKYPQNWPLTRDLFLRYYELTGDASAANTLGYIYYNGRCSGGEGEYEQAFKYFSIGHAFGYFESTYKLADMFTHGYGVVKDGHTAYRLYSAVYSENKQRFLAGERTGKFADTALRMGNCYMDGIGVEKDLQEAYTCYLEADLAIRIRVKEANHYGDTSVYIEIQQALQNTRQEYTEHSTAYAEPYPGVFFAKVLSDNRRCRMTWKTLENGKMFLILTPMKLPAEWEVPKMMITYAQGDYCELVDSFMIRTEPGTYWLRCRKRMLSSSIGTKLIGVVERLRCSMTR